MSYKRGDVLLAKPALEGTYFENSLILLLDSNVDGVFGVILNRPSTMPISEVFTTEEPLLIEKRRFYTGGPVDEDLLLSLALIDTPDQLHDGTMVSNDVELGGTWPSIEEMLVADEERVRLYLGYAGWEVEQLDREIKEGSWYYYTGLPTRKLLEDWLVPKYHYNGEIAAYLRILA